MKQRVQLGLALTAALFLAAGAANAADVKKGKRVFNKCKACHTLAAGKNKIGPSLSGVIGRKAGTGKGFRYSKAMIAAGNDKNLVWNDENLDKYLTKPRKFIPRNKMAFAGVKKQADRDNLIAYLKEATK